ncbi:hypothetical protein E2542_SST16435 [Spatholobus suberectus]|nr:hypothetical protein E2542_SST16435 [Spatholobus suberectus]
MSLPLVASTDGKTHTDNQDSIIWKVEGTKGGILQDSHFNHVANALTESSIIREDHGKSVLICGLLTDDISLLLIEISIQENTTFPSENGYA